MYERIILFPWFAVGQGWETRLFVGTATMGQQGNKGGFSITLPSMINFRNIQLFGRIDFPLKHGEESQVPIGSLSSGFFPGLYEGYYLLDAKPREGGNSILTTGVVKVEFIGSPNSDPCAVNYIWENYAFSQLTFLYRDDTGTVRWMVSEPGYWVDELSPRWSAPISVSGPGGPDGRQFNDFEDPSFAVANAGDKEVIVRVRVYDNYGKPWLDEIQNPVVAKWQAEKLTKTFRLKPLETVAYIVRDLFGDALFQRLPNNTDFGYPFGFWGSLLFEAVDDNGNVVPDAKIIPVVLQRVGDALNNQQLTKLPVLTFEQWKAAQTGGGN